MLPLNFLYRLSRVFFFVAFLHSMTSFGLNILLTNDDGFDSIGILAMKTALTQAGHNVTIVAPKGNATLASASIGLGETLFVTTENPTTFSVLRVTDDQDEITPIPATPAEAVTVATVLLPSKPDLVISGINNGQNAGASTNISGTVGACVTVAAKTYSFGQLPCIAVSMEASLFSTRITPANQPYGDAADYIVKLINKLDIDDGNSIIKPGTYLNVNYPALPLASVKGVREVLQGDSIFFRESAFTFPPSPFPGGEPFPAGVYSIRNSAISVGSDLYLLFSEPVSPDPLKKNTDSKKLLDGYITVVLQTLDNSFQCKGNNPTDLEPFTAVLKEMRK